MTLSKLLNQNLIINLKKRKKKEVLQDLIHLIKMECSLGEITELKRSILHREKLMSTGVGLGIAVPHARIKGLNNIVIAIGISREGIEDYESIDGKPVKVVFMILVDEKQHREYIKVLSQIVKLVKKEDIVSKMIVSEEPDRVIQIISEGE